GLLLGIINILIVVVILVLVGVIIQWVLTLLGWPPPQLVVKLYLAIVALIALYLFVALLLGAPAIHIIGGHVNIAPPFRVALGLS
ncbi:MAG TPA: hypothetical protein VKB76_17510, partial [Ktedonobacterales bacterium]|nr:hypothetical protein [Ktedonobacterales bacterium]